MKKLNILILLATISLTAMGQVDRTKFPTPSAAPEINIGDPATFELENGLKVFVVENHKLPRVNYLMSLNRKPILEKDKAGLTSLFGSVIMGGTNNLTKEQLDDSIDQIGANINISSTSASASSLKKHNTELLKLFSEVLFNSSFSESELKKTRKQMISGLAAQREESNSISEIVSNAVTFGKNHPFGENETEQTLNNIQIEDIKQYYDSYFRPNIAYLAIVGDITVDEAKELVTNYFSDWKKKEVPGQNWTKPSSPKGRQVILVDRPTSEQSALKISYTIDLQPNSEEVQTSYVVNNILGGGFSGRLFQNIREDKGYSYGAYSTINPNIIIGSVNLYSDVNTNVTDSAINEFILELKRISQNTIKQEELDISKSVMAGSFARSLENPSTIARFAINTEINNMPKDYYKNYLKNLEAIDLRKANGIAAKYYSPDNIYITVVGKGSVLTDRLQKIGKVTLYSVNGDPIVKSEESNKN